MTSGIPTFDEQPAFEKAYVSRLYREFSKKQLVSYVIGAPRTSGYSYSNTNYILAEMTIEKASRDSYEHQLYARIIRPLGPHDMFYRPSLYPPRVTAREPAGYYMDTAPALASLVGRDVSRRTLSPARGAGGIISTTRDMTVWERALYSGALLPRAQQAELTSLVSTKDGHPIERTVLGGPAGFGLGLTQETSDSLGTFWFYEGGTFGFRTIHLYVPKWNLILALGLNSYTTPNTDNTQTDHITDLVGSVVTTLIKDGAISALAAPSRA
jgi:D-alanyl-D-alanine carboxypeptidase